VQVRHVLPGAVDAVAAVLARSFHDDPQMAFLLPDGATRTEDLTAMFAAILEAGTRRGHTLAVHDDDGTPVAGTIWSPPGTRPLDAAEGEVVVAPVVARYGDDGLLRLGALAEATDAHHPAEPHHYLFIAGVDPAQQGRGLGAVALAPTLALCDATGSNAYLESSNPRNVPFYERHGFAVVSEFHADGGPLFTGMWRDARG
jgi:GNAT superfamily N-acetyltransferase